MRYTVLLLFVFSFINEAFCQDGIAYYTDYNNNFIVFEKGRKYILEERAGVKNVKTGIDFVAYTDVMDNLKIFYNGETNTIESFIPGEMYQNLHSFIYKTQNKLVIYEKGIKKVLSERSGLLMIGEEIIVWQNEPTFDLMAYMNGRIFTIEKNTEFRKDNLFVIGKNLFAYNDLNNHLKIFSAGEVFDSKSSNITNFKCGRNTVAFYDPFYNQFKVFQNGIFDTVCSYQPKEFYAFDDQVSFIDIDNNWNVVMNGKIVLVTNNKSDKYSITKDFVFYYILGNSNNAENLYESFVYYKGEKVKLDNFSPNTVPLVSYHSVLYFDSQGRAYYFYDGKLYKYFLPQKNAIANLNYDLPSFKYDLNTIGFFYDGRLIEYPELKIEKVN